MQDPVFRGGVAVGIGIFMIAVLRMRFTYAFDVPEPPPSTSEMYAQKQDDKKEKPDSLAAARHPDAYERYLREDSEKYGILPSATPGSMSRVYEYARDDSMHEMLPGDTTEILGLRLTLGLTDLPNTAFRQMELRIENLRSKTVAYNIMTEPSVTAKACSRKRDLPHNAVAIRAKGVEIRSECVYREGWTLTIKGVEVMEVNELGYAYLSAVPPTRLNLDQRTSHGHKPPHEKTRICNLVHPVTVDQAIERGEVTWHDLVDFYARHRCETYVFSSKYRALTGDGTITLPFTE